MSRALASIQTIKSLEPIPNKDRILYASFESVGFRVIVSSDTKVGDKVIYCEVDSLLPIRPEFEFLRTRCYSDKWNGFRIRNMKMSEKFSEGLVIPVFTFPSLELLSKPDGYDLTSILGIRKYDPELLEEQAMLQNKAQKSKWMSLVYKTPWLLSMYRFFFVKKNKTTWPKWASKSDETRVQNLPYIFEKYQGLEVVVTEKIDGQSCLFGWVDGKFRVCSRNLDLTSQKGKIKSNYWEYATLHDIESKLKDMRKEIGEDFYIQGELTGPGIQGNKYGFSNRKYFIFNIKTLKSDTYLSYDAIQYWCKKYNFEAVPYLGKFEFNFKKTEDLLNFAEGYSVWGMKVLREGVVIRSSEVMPPDRGQSNLLSFKVISPAFELHWSK